MSTLQPRMDTGGYGYDFVDSIPDRLVYKACHLPSRDPYLTTCCGHVFCKSCQDNNAAKETTRRGRGSRGSIQFVEIKHLLHFVTSNLIEKLKVFTLCALTEREVVSGRVT